MKKRLFALAACLTFVLGWAAVRVLAADDTVSIQDFSDIDLKDAKSNGTFQDNQGSKITLEMKGKAPKITLTIQYSLVQGGYCGLWCRAGGADWSGVDLSTANAIQLSVHSKAPVVLGVALKDKNNNQYVADALATKGGSWETVSIPLGSFQLDPYYTPPDAIKGAPRDFSQVTTFNIQPKTVGESALEIGPLKAVGGAPSGPAPAVGALSPTGGRVIEDWYFSPFQMIGAFVDPIGSKCEAEIVTGPGGRKALKLTSNLVRGGWCGIGRNIPPMDLSKNTCFNFKAKASVSGEVQISLKDAYNVQYTTLFQVTPGDWAEVTVPFSSFQKDASYQPPGAHPGHPMDLRRTTNISLMPRIFGDSVLEIGPIEAAGTGGAFLDPNKGKTGAGTRIQTVKITRSGGTPISPFAFGNCYFDWVDWGKNGLVGLKGSEDPVKALHLNVIVGANNQNDANTPQLFDRAQEVKFIEYCRSVGAEPIMIVPIYGNNVNGGPTSAKMAADIVTYINGTQKYGVKYWTIGDEVDIYDLFFRRKTDLPVSNVSQYASLYNSFARAMVAANKKAHSGVELKFVGPELGAKFNEGDDWLSPMLDRCKDYIDVVSVHSYGFAARELSAEGVLTDIDAFPRFISDLKARIARHARPGTALAITEANVCYDAFTSLYNPATRKVGPGTFYAALWDADRMGAALEADLWTHAFWNLAEPVQMANSNVFGFVRTDPSKDPPTYKLSPEYYAQQMVATSFSGTTVKPSPAPEGMSVYASYDAKKAATAVLVLNKDKVVRALTLTVDTLKPRKIKFTPMSINLVTLPDDASADYRMTEYTIKMADADQPPKAVR